MVLPIMMPPFTARIAAGIDQIDDRKSTFETAKHITLGRTTCRMDAPLVWTKNKKKRAGARKKLCLELRLFYSHQWSSGRNLLHETQEQPLTRLLGRREPARTIVFKGLAEAPMDQAFRNDAWRQTVGLFMMNRRQVLRILNAVESRERCPNSVFASMHCTNDAW
jgi:hypothetical protein